MSRWTVALFLTLAAWHSHAVADLAARYRLNVPPQPVFEALKEFAVQTKLQVIYYSDVAQGLSSPGAVGELTAGAALQQLLVGTGLRYVFVNDRTVAIRASGSEAESPASSQAGTAQGAFMLAQISAAGASSSAVDGAAHSGQSAAAQPAQSAAPERSAEPALEEVIVTATKRAQNIQDVPVSITALGSTEIENRGLRGMGDYLSSVPGVSLIEVNSTSNAVVMRGIDTGPVDQNFGAGTTVATYFGETPISNSAGLLGGSGVDLKLVDIARIEVLRGPQGTAFGNSSLGGAVRTIPMAPRLDDLGGKLLASYSNTGRGGSGNSMFQGVLNLPLIQDRLAIRAVGYKYDNSGYYKNSGGTDPLLQDYAASIGPRAVSLTSNFDDRGSDAQFGGRLALLFQATEDLKIGLSYLHQKIEQDGLSSATGRGGRYAYRSFRILESRGIRGSVDSVTDNRIGIANATVEYAFPWADLVTSASWVDAKTEQANGASLFAPYDFVGRSPHESFAGEIRLVSRLEGPLQFIAGYYHEKLDDSSSEVYGSLETPALELQNTGFGDGVNEVLGIFDNARDLKQDALFGEVSYEIVQNLTLTVGGRFYKFDRKNRLETSGWFTGAPLGSPDVSVIDLNKSGENFKANLGYKPRQNTLLYASWAQGFRLGRPAAGLIPAICDTDGDGVVDGSNVTIDSTREIDSDTLDNYELGGKFTLREGRMLIDTSVYRIDWKGLPTNATAQCGRLTVLLCRERRRGALAGLRAAVQHVSGARLQARLRRLLYQCRAQQGRAGPECGEGRPPAGLAPVDRKPRPAVRLLDVRPPGFVRADSAYRGTFFGNLAEDALTSREATCAWMRVRA